MSKSATQALDRLALEFASAALGDNPTRDELLVAMILRLDERVTSLEAEASARRRAVADEDLSPRPPGDWVSLKEAAFRSGRSLAWLHKWRRKGAIAQHLEGGNVLVDLDSVRRAIARLDRTQKT
jgi:hypothetical protein